MSRIKELISKYVPLDKSWVIRMGILDLTRGYDPAELIHFLNTQEGLGGDLLSLKSVAEAWLDSSKSLDVGESGTIYRFIRFYTLLNRVSRKIAYRGTLVKRVTEMCQDPDIIYWPLSSLLTLDGGTTQWATMAILMGNKETLVEVPFYLQKTYDALADWKRQRSLLKKMWEAQTDSTLTAQCHEYITYLLKGKIHIFGTRLGDCDLYCFLRAFDKITSEEGKRIWPQIQFHESDRIKEMETTLAQLYSGGKIHSNDHRVVQACAMLIQSNNLGTPIEYIRSYFIYPDCVNKTWPRFWSFLGDVLNVI